MLSRFTKAMIMNLRNSASKLKFVFKYYKTFKDRHALRKGVSVSCSLPYVSSTSLVLQIDDMLS